MVTTFQALDVEEQGLIAADEEVLQVTDTEPGPVTPKGRALKKGALMLLALGAVGALCVMGTGQNQQQEAKVHFVGRPLLSKLHRASKIISLYEKFNKLTKPGKQTMDDVDHAINEVDEATQFKYVGKDSEKGGKFANGPVLKKSSELGLSPAKMDEINGMFNMVDGDRDGQISEAELQTTFTKLEPGSTPEYVHDSFEEMGPQREDPVWLVSHREFANFEAYMMSVEGDNTDIHSAEKIGELAQELLDSMDSDKNGKLDHVELSHFLVLTVPPAPHGLPEGVTVEDVTVTLLKLFDTDKDGELSKTEIEELIQATN